MDTERRRSPLRILAPVALVAAAASLFLIVTTSGGNGDEPASKSAKAAEKERDLGTSAEERRAERRRARRERDEQLPQDVYIVKEGDTLGEIAERTGVPVEKLQELNPDLDQFSLATGQKIKLR
jgi:hypothetical protein